MKEEIVIPHQFIRFAHIKNDHNILHESLITKMSILENNHNILL